MWFVLSLCSNADVVFILLSQFADVVKCPYDILVCLNLYSRCDGTNHLRKWQGRMTAIHWMPPPRTSTTTTAPYPSPATPPSQVATSPSNRSTTWRLHGPLGNPTTEVVPPTLYVSAKNSLPRFYSTHYPYIRVTSPFSFPVYFITTGHWSVSVVFCISLIHLPQHLILIPLYTQSSTSHIYRPYIHLYLYFVFSVMLYFVFSVILYFVFIVVLFFVFSVLLYFIFSVHYTSSQTSALC